MRRNMILASVVSITFALTGCSGEEPSEDESKPAPTSGEGGLSNVKSGLSAPTGTVDEQTAPAVLRQYEAQGNLEVAGAIAGALPGFEAVGDVGALLGNDLDSVGGDLDDLGDDLDDLGDNLDDIGDQVDNFADSLEDSLAALENVDEDILLSCLNGSSTAGTLDLSCASGGGVSGAISFNVDLEGTSQLLELTFNDVCNEEGCLNGTLAVEAIVSNVGAEVYSAAELGIQAGDQAINAAWGAHVVVSASGATAEWVVFDATGDSFVLNASASAEGGFSVSLEGANGSYSCEYDPTTDAGSCDGTSGTISW